MKLQMDRKEHGTEEKNNGWEFSRCDGSCCFLGSESPVACCSYAMPCHIINESLESQR